MSFDGALRAQVYRHFAVEASAPSLADLAVELGTDTFEVAAGLERLADAHRLVLVLGEPRIWMAHPFSGIPTDYTATVDGRSWFANCAWDALGILSVMGDGRATCRRPDGDVAWEVVDGKVDPNGIVHLQVPARDFWKDIGYT